MDPFEQKLPIAVDLDGTLIFNDISRQSLRMFCKAFPFKIVLLPFWLLKGVAYVKSRLAEVVVIPPESLRFNPAVLNFIKKHPDHRFLLATGADERYAHAVAKHLGCFDDVIASNGVLNSISEIKASRLNKLLGQGMYIYLGNSSQDIAVWQQSAYAIAVNAPDDVVRALAGLQMPYHVLDESGI